MSDSAPESDAVDLFVSYAHADNADGWLTDFVKAIREDFYAFSTRPLRAFFGVHAIRNMQARQLYLRAMRAIQIETKHFDADRPSLAISYGNLAQLDLAMGDRQAARELAEKSLAILRKRLPPRRPTHCHCRTGPRGCAVTGISSKFAEWKNQPAVQLGEAVRGKRNDHDAQTRSC